MSLETTETKEVGHSFFLLLRLSFKRQSPTTYFIFYVLLMINDNEITMWRGHLYQSRFEHYGGAEQCYPYEQTRESMNACVRANLGAMVDILTFSFSLLNAYYGSVKESIL